MIQKVPKFALEAIAILQAKGYEAHLVGGCVRDFLLGKEPVDYDINTNALPQQIKEAFEGYNQVDTGIKHGTVSVWISGHQIEITTYRADGKYSDGRHPDRVSMGVDLEEDLRRRDFTINAMCWAPDLNVTDLFGGKQDLDRRIIRCIGNPQERFSEDALRILRALRFAAVLDATIEENTDKAIRAMAGNLELVSRERCAIELVKLLKGSGASRIITEYSRVLDMVVPGLCQMEGYNQQNPYHCYTLLEHTAKVVEKVPPTTVERLAALLHDIAKPQCRTTDDKGIAHYKGHPSRGAEKAQEILEKLHMDRATIQRVVLLVKHHDDNIDGITEPGVRRLLGRLGVEAFDQLMNLKRADNLAQNRERSDRLPNIARTLQIKEDILAKKLPYELRHLEIDGQDLICAGIAPGPDLGKMLEELLKLVLEGKLENTKEDLLKYVFQKFKQ